MIDPCVILGVDAGATDEEIRAAYLRKVRDYPPERAPEQFERVRDAYEMLRDPRRRMQQRLFAPADAAEPLATLFGGGSRPRRFVGPGPWVEVLKSR
jgi:DnaJ-class molecular chaperone